MYVKFVWRRKNHFEVCWHVFGDVKKKNQTALLRTDGGVVSKMLVPVEIV